ncbi:M2 family metallopeptidase [Paenibacillus sp. UNC499MF]|uniref:M2 family metallopeptidase n=1 Tax=Paenibacillus sp. UNC499MF TaxID=1502751 RepID=UPI0021563187|nr:M2 family metallopeptidase [Paenibacillus sp. UNC499MF]
MSQERFQTGAGSFLREANRELAGLYVPMMNSLWKVITTGEFRYVKQCEQDEKAYQEALASPVLGGQAEYWLNRRGLSAEQKRQLQVLKAELAEYRMEANERQAAASLWNDLHYTIGTFRAEAGGALLSEHAAHVLMRRVSDGRQRKQIWQAGMRLGGLTAPKLLELVKLRNRAARRLGYDDYFAMKLENAGVGLDTLTELIRQIRGGLDSAYREVKGGIDLELADRFHIARSEVRSWHYTHPFFQTHFAMEEPLGAGTDEMADKVSGWLRERGCDLSAVIRGADLAERPGKSQANCCLNLDRSRDIRMSCNLSPDTKGLAVLLHESGHALFEKELDPSLPFLLRQPAHPFLSEGAALLMERLAWDEEWKRELFGGEPGPGAGGDAGSAQEKLRKETLVRLYWTLTLVEFEKQLYANPDQPLNGLWWDLVEDVQGITRPSEWDYPYWAAKAHLSTLPVYYYNYLLGEAAASQFQHTLQARFKVWHGKEALGHLRKEVFRPGASASWRELLAAGTSQDLNPLFLIRQLRG